MMGSMHERGSGRTRKQMEAMRDGDIFIVDSHHMIAYAKAMAHDLGMRNIRVISKSVGPNEIRGLQNVLIVVDHACDIGDARMREFIHLNNSKVTR